ncbi:hypothetical protein EAF04_009533 [Stromatinia cepivora]|nr:hypothetical protein EAF04_009533 [Stromatinia cepivora]
MNILLSILLFASALVAEATSGRDASNSPVNAVQNEVRDIFDGGLILPGTSLVTVNNVVVATTSSDFGSIPISTTIDRASAAASTLSDNFPPVSPGHSNVHSSSHDSTTVIFSTVTLPPTTSVAVEPVAPTVKPIAPTTSLLSAVDEQGAALVSSGAATTSHSAPATSDVTQPIVLETSSLEPETVQPSPVQSSVVKSSTAPSSTVQPSIAESSAVQSSVVESSATPSTSQSSAAQPSTIQSSEVPSLSVQSSAAPSSTFESSSAQPYTFQPPVTKSSASPSSSVSSLPAQSLTIQPTSLESSATQSTAESSISQVSAAPSLPIMSAISPAPFLNSTASLVQSLSSSVVYPTTTIVPVSSALSPSTSAISVIVGTSQTNSASLPTNTPTYNNVSSSAVSGIVGTSHSIIFSSSPSAPASKSTGTTETTTTRTTTITSTTTRTGTITTTITRSSANITSQSIIGKLPVTGAPQAGLTTETFTSGGSTWTTTETGPPRTVTASLMLNPSLSASNNGGVLTSNGAAPSGACTCPPQVTVTVTATPSIVTGSTASASAPEKSISSSSYSTTYYQPPQESWTTHSVPGFIGVTIPSGGMSYPPKATTYSSTSSNIPSATYAATTPAYVSISHTHPYMSIEPTPNLSVFSNYSSTSTGSLLGTNVGTGVGTSITQSYHPTTRLSSGVSPSTTSFKPFSPMYSGNAEINAVGTESVALIVGFVALVLLV